MYDSLDQPFTIATTERNTGMEIHVIFTQYGNNSFWQALPQHKKNPKTIIILTLKLKQRFIWTKNLLYYVTKIREK